MFFWVFPRRQIVVGRQGYKIPCFLSHLILYIQPLKMELTHGSETSANYNLTPGKYPKEHIQYSNHGQSLKSRIRHLYGEDIALHIRRLEKLPIKKTNSSPPSPSFSAAEITTLFPVFYRFITISAPVLPTEFINEPALLYSEKEYNRTDENWTPHHVFC